MAQRRSGQIEMGLDVARRRPLGAALNDETQDFEPGGVAEGAQLFGVSIEFVSHLLLLIKSKKAVKAYFEKIRNKSRGTIWLRS
jgi:hypothetical protein